MLQYFMSLNRNEQIVYAKVYETKSKLCQEIWKLLMNNS